MTPRIETRTYAFPQTLLGRFLSALLAAALLVAAFFFLFFFLAVAGVVVTGFALRALWRSKQARAQASPDVLEGEYTVEISEVKRLDDAATDTTQKH